MTLPPFALYREDMIGVPALVRQRLPTIGTATVIFAEDICALSLAEIHLTPSVTPVAAATYFSSTMMLGGSAFAM